MQEIQRDNKDEEEKEEQLIDLITGSPEGNSASSGKDKE